MSEWAGLSGKISHMWVKSGLVSARGKTTNKLGKLLKTPTRLRWGENIKDECEREWSPSEWWRFIRCRWWLDWHHQWVKCGQLWSGPNYQSLLTKAVPAHQGSASTEQCISCSLQIQISMQIQILIQTQIQIQTQCMHCIKKTVAEIWSKMEEEQSKAKERYISVQ